MSLFATKPISRIIAEAEETGEHTLKKALSALDLTTLGIGAIIGTGIFVLTGQAAGKHAGPAVIVSMILAGIVSAFAALCYSEFAASVPISGSAYAYGYGTLGEFVAWIIGWDLILEYAFGAATVAVGWSGYVVSLFRDTLGINFPLSLSKGPFDEIPLADGTTMHGLINLPGVLIAVAVTLLLIRGIKESASFNSIIVIVKVLVVVLFIVAGIGYVNKSNIGLGCVAGSPGCAEFMPYGFSGVVTGAAVMVPGALFRAVGGFTEDYIIGDYEDSDLCLKLRRAGRDVLYVPAAELHHFERKSIERHAGYMRGVASEYNGWLHHQRWDATIATLMEEFTPAIRAERRRVSA